MLRRTVGATKLGKSQPLRARAHFYPAWPVHRRALAGGVVVVVGLAGLLNYQAFSEVSGATTPTTTTVAPTTATTTSPQDTTRSTQTNIPTTLARPTSGLHQTLLSETALGDKRGDSSNPSSATITTADPPTATSPAPTTTNAGESGSPQPVGHDSGPWNLTFDSEFNGSSLDASQWSTGWFGSGITRGANKLEQECMDPAQVGVTNGALNLTALAKQETCNGVTELYTSGMVTTHGHFTFTYGYMEARIWLSGSGSVADWPAFWAVGQTPPTDGEIDVIEGIGGRLVAHLHNSAGSQGPLSGAGIFTAGWHTVAADWEPGSVTYFYDGTEIGRFTSGITSAPMYLILDLALSTAITSPATAPATMQIDYVRVWQH